MPALGFLLGAELGDDEDLAAILVDYVADWTARLRSRIYEQFKGKPRLEAAIDAFAEQIQALEDSGQALALRFRIDPVTSDPDSPFYWIGRGAQLRLIGRIVRQPYTGEPDEVYRLRLRARIRTNKSSGTPEDLYAIFVALFGGEGSARISRPSAATLLFRVGADLTLDGATAAVLLDFLRDGKVAGVKLYLEWTPADDVETFAFDSDDAGGLGFGDTDNPDTGGFFAGAALA